MTRIGSVLASLIIVFTVQAHARQAFRGLGSAPAGQDPRPGRPVTGTGPEASGVHKGDAIPSSAVPRAAVWGAPTDLMLRLSAFSSASALGSPRPLHATVVNLGPNPATAVRLFWHLPEGVELSSSNLYPQGACAAASRLLSCNLGGLQVGESSEVTLVVVPNRTGTLYSVVSLVSENLDTIPSNNDQLVAFSVDPAADLELLLTTDSDLLAPQTELVYHLRLSNRGPSPAREVVLTDQLPNGVTLIQSSLPTGCRFLAPGSQPGFGRVRCDLGRLEPSQSVQIDLSALSPDSLGQFVNRASAEAAELDPDLLNNQAVSVNRVVPEGDLNGDGVIDVSDLGALVRELNDGDGEALEAIAGGSFRGNALFDVNRDGLVNEQDVGPLMARILR